jgi:hypothetical protein
MVPSLGQMAF